MPYDPTVWIDDETPVDEVNLNHMETGIDAAHATADAAVPKSIVDAAGDLLVGSGADALERLAVGANGQILRLAAGMPRWEAPTNLGYVPASVVDAAGDLIVGSGPDAVARLGKGVDGQVLKTIAGSLAWADETGGGGGGADWSVIDAAGDLIVGSGPDAVARLAKGVDGQVLKTVAGALAWADETGGGGGGLPADTVIAAGTRIIANKLLAGDTEDAWRVLGSGKQEWGAGGASAPDTNLYRAAADTLRTDDRLSVIRDLIVRDGTAALQIAIGDIFGDTLRAGIAFGTTADTVLYRSGPNTLQTDDEFRSIRGGGTSGVLSARVSSDTSLRFYLDANGRMDWGPGGAAPTDTSLYRDAADSLKTDDLFSALGINLHGASGVFAARAAGAGGTTIFAARASGDSQDRMTIGANGTIQLGSGAAARDVELGRSGQDVLYLGDGDGLQLGEAAADLAAPAANRVRIYAKDNGSGATGIYARFPTGSAQPILIDGVAPGAGALTVISDKLLAADGAIDFTAIPGTYKSLLLVGQVRGMQAVVLDWLALRFNNDTAANYRFQQLSANGATVAGVTPAAGAYGRICALPAASATAGIAAVFVVEIPCYAETVFNKAYLARGGDAHQMNYFVNEAGGWASTAAITRVTLIAESGNANFKTGSHVTLYGVN